MLVLAPYRRRKGWLGPVRFCPLRMSRTVIAISPKRSHSPQYRIFNDEAGIKTSKSTYSRHLSASRPFPVPATTLLEPKQPSSIKAEWKIVVMNPQPWPPESPPASFQHFRSLTPTAAPGRASEEPSDGTEGSLSASLVTGAS